MPHGRGCVGLSQRWGHSQGPREQPRDGNTTTAGFRKARHASASNDFQTHGAALGQREGLIDLPTSLLSLLSVILQPL